MFSRVNTLRTNAKRMDDVARVVHDVVLPAFSEEPGFRRYIVLGDRENGRAGCPKGLSLGPLSIRHAPGTVPRTRLDPTRLRDCPSGMSRLDEERAQRVAGDEEAAFDELLRPFERAVLVLDRDHEVVANRVQRRDEAVPAHLAEPR